MCPTNEKVKLVFLIFRDLKLKYRDLPKMRGYLAKHYPDINELHNHLTDKSFNYRYPVIQFRVINGFGSLIAIDKAVDLLLGRLLRTGKIEIGEDTIITADKEINIRNSNIGVTNQSYDYSFLSPWMALKEQNYQKYLMMADFKKQDFLRMILRENLKTLSKGFNYTIPDIEKVETDVNLKPIRVKFKNQVMLCFKGSFKVNFEIPDYLALGKQVARGFGVVRKKKG